jgi:hypothetical protein
LSYNNKIDKIRSVFKHFESVGSEIQIEGLSVYRGVKKITYRKGCEAIEPNCHAIVIYVFLFFCG